VRLLVALQNGALLFLRRLLFRRDPCSPERILIFRSSAVGDFICALPALHGLRKRFPQARITLMTTPTGNPKYWDVVRQAAAQELASPRLVDSVLLFDARRLRSASELVRLRKQLQALNPDHVYLLPFTGEPFIRRLKKFVLLWLLGIRRNLYGYRIDKTLGALQRAQFLSGGYPHQAVEALNAVNGQPETAVPEMVFCLDVPAQVVRRVDELWAEHQIDRSRPVIAMLPGARFGHKRWPLENYRALCERLVNEIGTAIVVLGEAQEGALLEKLRAMTSVPLVSLVGATNLLETAEALRRCNLYVGNDSGPAHLAAAVGTPCVTIFSSIVFPGIWEPWGAENIALRHHVPCEHCFAKDHCPVGTNACICGISVESVLAAVKERLAGGRASAGVKVTYGQGSSAIRYV